ncbi:MAG: NUDIX domain-containing protein [Patescibacteria group bacterium]
MSIDNLYFRAGVGMIVVRDTQVALFERQDVPGNWQFPQGGISLGESPEEAMYRELEEETGITSDDILEIKQVPFLTSYAYPQKMWPGLPHTNNTHIGQSQFWYIITLKEHSVINLNKASDYEFINYKWVSYDEIIDEIIEWKRPTYEQLIRYLKADPVIEK